MIDPRFELYSPWIVASLLRFLAEFGEHQYIEPLLCLRKPVDGCLTEGGREKVLALFEFRQALQYREDIGSQRHDVGRRLLFVALHAFRRNDPEFLLELEFRPL